MFDNVPMRLGSLGVAMIVGWCGCVAQLAAAEARPAVGQRQFSIIDYSAVEGGKELCTEAIQKAIDACTASGGGRVVIPQGTFLSGTIVLNDNVNLHLDEGAVLLGSPTIRDYPAQYPKMRQRYDWFLRTSLVFAQGARNISVTGKGTLDGNSKAENDFMEDGRYGKYRPTLIWFDECTEVLFKGVTCTSSGFWTTAYTQCRNVLVDGMIVVDSTFWNNDGCNIIDCENFVVQNCDINASDDTICMKGYTATGCKNVIIRNNRLRSVANAIKMGTDSSGGFQNVLIENNEIYNTALSGIALEATDGGVIQNVIIRNITMDRVGSPIFIKLGNRNRPIYVDGKKTKVANAAIRDVHISGIRATVNKARYRKIERRVQRKKYKFKPYASSITGFPGHDVERVTIEDVEIEIQGGFPKRTKEHAQRQIPEGSRGYPEHSMFGILPAYGFFIRHVKDLEMSNIRVTIKKADARPAFVLDDVRDSVFREVQTKSVTDTPAFVIKENCTGVEVVKP